MGKMEACGEPRCLEPLDSVRFPWLFLGDRRAARNEQLLRRQKIAYIVNCTPPCGEGGVPNFHERLSVGSRLAFRYLRVPIFDTQAETLQPHFESVWEFMETCRTREDGNLLIHCNQGVSRSVALICSYFIKYEGMSVDEALAFVRRRNPLAQPNESFRSQLEVLYECVKKESRSVHSEPRRLPQAGWLPPFANARKRVTSCSLPVGRPQQKVMRLIGPARPPATDITPPSSATEGEHSCRETNTPSGSSVSSPTLNSSPHEATDTEAERGILVEEEPTQEKDHIQAGRECGESTTAVDGANDERDSSDPTCEFSVHSVSDVDSDDAIPVSPSDDCCEQPMGCKDTPLHEDPPAADSVISSPCAQAEQQPEHSACEQKPHDDSEASAQAARGALAAGEDCRSPTAAGRPVTVTDPAAAAAEDVVSGRQKLLHADAADHTAVLDSACEAPSWNLQPFAEQPENRRTASRSTVQAAALSVL
ncbi:dual specificity protein phosphatase, catalytic domain-containing protein, putative [Eimeria mitis]|uniref:protein-tyrosine-phosphatase n=1 Tax=Eimeria mitis TaxID=44415 RepID=U6JWL9_9EIME|nr:dual specificity protein phosphatase, catalytic domain-containing protein, putative [Eimeria mitis]CDJ29181.1 dual specificity protein phosphatase, catalytic domain-containing protein, putative [Eimeria mitis]